MWWEWALKIGVKWELWGEKMPGNGSFGDCGYFTILLYEYITLLKRLRQCRRTKLSIDVFSLLAFWSSFDVNRSTFDIFVPSDLDL